MFMNTIQEIQKERSSTFKRKSNKMGYVDKQIEELNKQVRELKKVRDKELQPSMTEFMVKFQQAV